MSHHASGVLPDDKTFVLKFGDLDLQKIGAAVEENKFKRLRNTQKFEAEARAMDNQYKKIVDHRIADVLPEDDTLADLSTGDQNRKEYISNKKIFLTHKGRIDEDHYTRWLTELSEGKRLTIMDITFAYSREQKETYILVFWDHPFRSKSRSVLDYDGEHPEIKYLTKKHYEFRASRFMEKVKSESV